ncbi:ABC transporter ATP-binding protein [Streptomonospora sediminis]
MAAETPSAGTGKTRSAWQGGAGPVPLARFYAYVRPHRGALLVVLLLTLGGSAAGLMQPLLASSIISALQDGGDLTTPVLLLVLFVVCAAVLNAAQIWFGERVSQNMVIGVRKGIIRRLMRLRVAEFDRGSAGDLTTRVTSDSQLLQQASSSGLIQVVNGALTLVAALAIMAVLHLPLFGITSATMVGIGILTVFFMPRIRAASDAAQQEIGVIGAALDRSLGAARTVKANRAEERESRSAEKAAERAYTAGMRGARYQAVIGVLSGLAIQVSFLVVLGFGGAFVAAGTLELGVLIAFLLYLFRLAAPVLALVTGCGTVFQGLGALRRIDDVFDRPTEDDVDGGAGESRPPMRPPALRLRDVSFAYPDRGEVLSAVSFDAPAGARTALVGPSGAGKTTIFSLLQRFYEPDSGRILFDDLDIGTRPRSQVRDLIAYVEQESPIMDGSIRENLRYGAPEADDAEIDRALRQTRMAEFVAGLPEGLDSPVGARGVTLSGGQRQRLAIARALLRRPAVLLLDEVTSQLDARSEAALQQTVEDIAAECTVVLIAHRLSTVASADRIVLVEDGRVRAVGDHASLLAEDSLYQELARTQLLAAEHLAPQPPTAT